MDLAVLFYTREKELASWADELRQELQQEENAAESLETVERYVSLRDVLVWVTKLFFVVAGFWNRLINIESKV